MYLEELKQFLDGKSSDFEDVMNVMKIVESIRGDRFDSHRGIDHDGDRLDGAQHRKRAAEEVRIAGRVDQVEVQTLVVEGAD